MNNTEFTICEIKNYLQGSMNNISAKGCNLAIEALEKEIPKQTITIKEKNVETSKCSVCGREFYSRYNYCPNCGQRLERV